MFIEKLNEILTPMSIEIGYGGLSLFSQDELKEFQLGYSIGPDGEDLTGSDDGDWLGSWVVIGSDCLVGDPIFVDTEVRELPVYTAAHGEGDWYPKLMASSYRGFLDILEHLKDLSIGRETPAAYENNPLSESQFDEFVAFATERGELSDPSVWEILLESDE